MNKVNWKSKSTWIIVFSLLCNFILGCAVYTYYDQSVQQQRDYNALQEQHELLQKNTSELNNKIDALQSQLDETQPTIDELQSQLSSLTSENTSLQAAKNIIMPDVVISRRAKLRFPYPMQNAKDIQHVLYAEANAQET